jgi:lipopolysaccharide biosynthesis regulator YciM
MGYMSTRTKTTQERSELEIDQIVVAQADHNTAWEQPIRVERSKPASLSLPGDLAARAAFLAQLHRTKNVEEWLTRVIQERVELEEAVFVGIKQDLAVRTA